MKYITNLPNYFTITLTVFIVAYIFLANTSHQWANDYYARLGSAFMAGQTYLETSPSDSLLALSNPYEPKTRNWIIGTIEDKSSFNQKIGFIWDSSLYKGKYYLYFGPVPALMPWIPLKWLTGISLTDRAITLFYALLGSLSLIILLYRVMRRIHLSTLSSKSNVLVWFSAALPLCFGTTIPILLKRPMFYETAITGAYAYTALGIILLWYAYMEQVRKPLFWKLVASLCFGLAAGCRIFYCANALILLVVWLSLFNTKSINYSLKEALALFAPWCLVIISIAAYNYVRFDSVLETGIRYQLGLENYNLLHSRFDNAQNFLVNLQAYLFTPIPADHLIPWKPTFGRANIENIFGIVTNNVFLLWCLCIPPTLRAIPTFMINLNENRFIRSLLTGIALYGTACFILMLFYNWHLGRYMADFTPWLMLCASFCFVWQACKQQSLRRRQIILTLGAITSAWTVYSGFFSFSCIKCF